MYVRISMYMFCLIPHLQGLFRKVCFGEISPSQLVRMNTEQFASDELAEWREKTLKKVCIYMYMYIYHRDLCVSGYIHTCTYVQVLSGEFAPP